MDRLRKAWQRAVKSALSGVDYFALYRARVVKQSGQTVDLKPDDARIPDQTGVRLRHGVPGMEVTIAPGSYLLLGWDNGDPELPFAALWDGGETVVKLKIGGQLVEVGGNTYSALKTEQFAAALDAALQTIVASNGGGNVLSDGGIAMGVFRVQLTGGNYGSLVVKHG